MLSYSLVYFLAALVAAILGFGSLAASAAEIARILFVLFMVMAIASFFVHWMGRR